MTAPANDPSPPAATTPVFGRVEQEKLEYRTHELFQGRRELWIEHGDEQYKLRITSSGKLLLTK